jgi:hypothetical protein
VSIDCPLVEEYIASMMPRCAQLPVALFRHEWFVCGHNRKKRDKPLEDKYVPLTHLERSVPVAFAVLYIGLGAYSLLVPSGGKGGTQQAPKQDVPAATDSRR